MCCFYILQRKEIRPSYEDLICDVIKIGYKSTAIKYNVSDGAIRKWIIHYEKSTKNEK